MSVHWPVAHCDCHCSPDHGHGVDLDDTDVPEVPTDPVDDDGSTPEEGEE